MKKSINKKFLEAQTPQKVLGKGTISTITDMPVPESMRAVISYKYYGNTVTIHTELEDIRWNGEYIIHIVNNDYWNERLLKMLWVNLTGSVWDI